MRLFNTGRCTAIGVDIGASVIKLAQARLTARGPEVLATAAVERPSAGPLDAATAGLVAQAIRRRGFAGRRLAVAPPMGTLRVESLDLPAGAAAAAASSRIAGVELGRIAKLRPGSFEHAVWDLPALARGGKATHVMAVGLAHADADAIVDPLVDAGLDVVSVCPLPNALNAWTARQTQSPDEAVHSIVDIGWSGTRFIIGNAERVLYFRCLDEACLSRIRAGIIAAGAAQDVADHALRSLGMSLASAAARRALEVAVEAIAHELRLTHAYVGHRYQQLSLGDLWITGGGASVPGLAAAIAEATGQEARVLGAGSSAWVGAAGALATALYAQEQWQ